MTTNKRITFGLILVLGCMSSAASAQSGPVEPADAGDAGGSAAASTDSAAREGVPVHSQVEDTIYEPWTTADGTQMLRVSPAGSAHVNTIYEPWTTADGTKMLRVTPAGSAHLRIKRCQNGRLISAEQGDSACRPN